MIRDIIRGAKDAARALHVQYADAQDAIQDATLAALSTTVRNPYTFGRTVASSAILKTRRGRRTVGLEETVPAPKDRTADLGLLRQAIERAGADRWYDSHPTRRARDLARNAIRTRLARELRKAGL